MENYYQPPLNAAKCSAVAHQPSSGTGALPLTRRKKKKKKMILAGSRVEVARVNK